MIWASFFYNKQAKKIFMKILFAIAHPKEMKAVKDAVKNLDIFWMEISFLLIWIWNLETVFNLTKYLEANEPDFIINIWLCWYDKDIGSDVIQIARTVNLFTNKELLVPISFIFTKLESIWCSDIPVKSWMDLKWECYFDMESFWFEFCASKYDIPRISLKIPSDRIWDNINKKSLESWIENLAKVDYRKLLEDIHAYDDRIDKPVDLLYLKNSYRFTFQEFEIMKKQVKKYEALKKSDFKDFYEKNKHLEKKEFVDKLKS